MPSLIFSSELGARVADPTHLLDNSAFARMLIKDGVRDALAPRLAAGELAICGVLRLEAGYSARNGNEHMKLQRAMGALPNIPIEPADWDRAIEVQFALARAGTHRGVTLPDLLTAAVGERTGLVVLHVDKDYDLIAKVTKQTVERVVLAS